MEIHVEPKDGGEVDRLVTALLNATAVIRRVIEVTPTAAAIDDEEEVGIVAAALSRPLSVLGEHHDDDELVMTTGFVAYAALLLADHIGIVDAFGLPGNVDTFVLNVSTCVRSAHAS